MKIDTKITDDDPDMPLMGYEKNKTMNEIAAKIQNVYLNNIGCNHLPSR
jgi:hypothetical protein